MDKLLAALRLLTKSVFVQWDRYTKTDDGFYVVYGWIPRPDQKCDFLVITYHLDDDEVWYTTSSAKYSKRICDLLYGGSDTHNDCRSVDELFAVN